MKLVNGKNLTIKTQDEALRCFVHRFTGEYIPNWIQYSKSKSPPHFSTDFEWLYNTDFYIKFDGSLDKRYNYCHTNLMSVK